MSQINLRTKFIGGISGLSIIVVLLIFSSLKAINSLDSQLNRMVNVDSARTEKIAAVSNSLTELTALHKDQLLRSILSDTSGVETARKAVAENEARIEAAFSEMMPLLDNAHDKQIASDLQSKAAAARQVSAEIDQLVAKQQMNDALKLVSEKLMPAYEQVLREARGFQKAQLDRQGESTASARSSASRSRLFAFFFVALTFAATGLLLLLFRRVIKDLTSMAQEVAQGASRVAGAAGQVNTVSSALAQGASEQAASLEETSASAEEINAMVQHNARNSEEAAGLTSMADKLLTEANQKLDQMLVSMRDISDSSEKISKIIRVIDEIAFQTNMLSLNAAVEAARAGEAGMGFAVVADEVRNLAQRCSQAARDTSALIEESINHARVGKVRVDEVATAMRQVTENSSVVGRLSQDVSTSSAEQARGIEQISKAIAQIQMVTQKNASNAEQGASAGSQLTDEARRLKSTVDHLGQLLGIAMGGRSENEAALAEKY